MDVLRAERICRSQTPAGIPHRQRRPASTQPDPWTDAVPDRGPEARGSGETTRNLRVGRRTPAIDQIAWCDRILVFTGCGRIPDADAHVLKSVGLGKSV